MIRSKLVTTSYESLEKVKLCRSSRSSVKKVFLKFCRLTGKHLCSSLFNKIADLRREIKRLEHGWAFLSFILFYFIYFYEILRTRYFTEHLHLALERFGLVASRILTDFPLPVNFINSIPLHDTSEKQFWNKFKVALD